MQLMEGQIEFIGSDYYSIIYSLDMQRITVNGESLYYISSEVATIPTNANEILKVVEPVDRSKVEEVVNTEPKNTSKLTALIVLDEPLPDPNNKLLNDLPQAPNAMVEGDVTKPPPPPGTVTAASPDSVQQRDASPFLPLPQSTRIPATLEPLSLTNTADSSISKEIVSDAKSKKPKILEVG